MLNHLGVIVGVLDMVVGPWLHHLTVTVELLSVDQKILLQKVAGAGAGTVTDAGILGEVWMWTSESIVQMQVQFFSHLLPVELPWDRHIVTDPLLAAPLVSPVINGSLCLLYEPLVTCVHIVQCDPVTL